MAGGRLIDLGDTHGAGQRIVSSVDRVFGADAGFGKRIEGGFTAQEIMTATDTDFEVELRPALVAGPGGLVVDIPNTFSVVRKDTGIPFGRTVGNQFTPVQNAELADFAATIASEYGQELRFEAGGHLRGGAVTWYYGKLAGTEATIRETELGKDRVQPGLFVLNAHDGTISMVGKFMALRMFCNNQIAGVLNQKVANQISLRKTKTIQGRMMEARRVLQGAIGFFDEHVAEMRALEAQPMDRREFSVFVDQLIGETQDAIEESNRTISERQRNFRLARRERLEHLFHGGLGNVGRSRFDAFQAVAEMEQHHVRRQNEETRFRSLAMPPPNDARTRALHLLRRR